ncbi:hypothetical protein BGX26_004305 [Mortierella sp. AD094]|nr:hypothetical protein BGX26_004305 [Mortierella sp. AD094]
MPPVSRRGIGFKPRQTYGRQRSFLDQDEDISPHEDGALSEEELQHSHSQLKRGNSDLSTQPPMKRTSSKGGPGTPRPQFPRENSQQGLKGNEEGNEQKTALKASHELREAGQNHRFKDEIEYILDGIRATDRLKIRRTSCIELTRSMLRREFATQVRAHQYMPIIFEIISNDQDPACRDVIVINNLAMFLCKSLEIDMDPMAMMPSVRQEMAMYTDFKDLARQSGIIQKGQKVLMKSIVLSIMTCIINEGVSMQDEHTLLLFDQEPNFPSTIIEILIEDLAWIKQPSSTLGVSLRDVLDIDRIENCLRILERYALVSKKPAAILSDNTRLFPLLVQLIALCRAHAFQYPQYTDSMNLMLHVLRLLINVTNGYEPCCENLNQSGSIQVLIQNFIQFYSHCRNYNPEEANTAQQVLSSEMERASEDSLLNTGLRMISQDTLETCIEGTKNIDMDAMHRQDANDASTSSFPSIKIENDANGWYDILLLSIGLLINMLETNPERREQVTRKAMSLDCKAIGDCFHKECRCEKNFDALERLVEIYNTEATISEMTEDHVLAAYLALLIGCIVGGDPDSESRLYSKINGQTLVPMLELLTEFAALNQAVQAKHFGFEDSNDQVMQTSQPSTDSDLLEDPKASSSISFSSEETQHSFFQIIDVLQDIEKRFSLS